MTVKDEVLVEGGIYNEDYKPRNGLIIFWQCTLAHGKHIVYNKDINQLVFRQ